MASTRDGYDVIVVGGGPAGSATAGLLAQDGRNVLLLEREKFPRYHIGESLIIGCWTALERLGLGDRMEQAGFQRKYGLTAVWGKAPASWRISFGRLGEQEYAYQVRRADFDALLLDRSRELGTRVMEETSVQAPLFEGERMVGVRYQTRGDEKPVEARARLVVDASGQQRWLGRHFDLVEWDEELRNVAVWAYYQGAGRLDGEAAGDLLAENRGRGWLWCIPFGDGTTGVGYVTPTSLLADAEAPLQAVLDAQINGSAKISELLRDATRVSAYRTTRDWSYVCKRFYGGGWLLAGDAAGFIDPLLSTGVTVALRAASTASRTVGRILDDPTAEERELRTYEAGYRKFLTDLLNFVKFFYDQSLTKADYDEEAQRVIDPGKLNPADKDFIRMVSGLSHTGDFVDPARSAAIAS